MNVKVVSLWGYRYQLLLQSENTRLTYNKFCALALGLTQVLTCSFSAPFHPVSRLITSSFQSATHALQLCWFYSSVTFVVMEIAFFSTHPCKKCPVLFFVRSLKLVFKLRIKHQKDQRECCVVNSRFLTFLRYLGPSREFWYKR